MIQQLDRSGLESGSAPSAHALPKDRELPATRSSPLRRDYRHDSKASQRLLRSHHARPATDACPLLPKIRW